MSFFTCKFVCFHYIYICVDIQYTYMLWMCCVLICIHFLVCVYTGSVLLWFWFSQVQKIVYSFKANSLCCCCFNHALKRCYLKVGAQVQVFICLCVATSAPIGKPICHSHCEVWSNHSLDNVCLLCCATNHMTAVVNMYEGNAVLKR